MIEGCCRFSPSATSRAILAPRRSQASTDGIVFSTVYMSPPARQAELRGGSELSGGEA